MKLIRLKYLSAILLITSAISLTKTLPAAPSSGINVTIDAEALLQQFLPRISYTGLAFAAGAAGICTSYYGIKHLCEPIENNKRSGKKELAIGLSTTAASIAIIHFLWNR